MEDSYSFPCAGAISIDNRGHLDEVPLITNSIFRNNSSQWTGSAIDMFGPGNAGEIRNCLFVGNVANRGYYTEIPAPKFHDENGSGALTIFPESKVIVDHCTFTGNYNGADDESVGSIYAGLYFLGERRHGAAWLRKRYELDIRDASNVVNCWFGGNEVIDLRDTISTTRNVLGCTGLEFDEMLSAAAIRSTPTWDIDPSMMQACHDGFTHGVKCFGLTNAFREIFEGFQQEGAKDTETR